MNNNVVNADSKSQLDRDCEIAHQSFSHHAKSFRLAARFLPQHNLDDVAVLYHFCRLVDDAVDESPTVEEAHQNLEEIERKLSSSENSEISLFKSVVEKYTIPLHAVRALMDGCESDLYPVRVSNSKELARYCYQVAGSVGEMMSPLLDVKSEDATKYAIDLGLAMQLTNICRDVLEDSQRGRVYLPSTWLKEAGLTPQDILDANISTDKISQVVNRVLESAESCYRRAYIGCRYIPFRSRLGILIARRVYRAIGLKLQSKHNSNPFHGRTILTKWEKMIQVCLGIFDAVNPTTLGLWNPKIPQSPMYTRIEELSKTNEESQRQL